MRIFGGPIGRSGRENCWPHSGLWGTTVVHCPRSAVTVALAVDQAKDFDAPSQQFIAKILRMAG